MATIVTDEDFAKAVSQLTTENFFGTVIYLNRANRQVLDDATLVDITPDVATLEAALDRANTTIASDTERDSFADEAEAAIRTAYRDSLTYNAAILSIQTILNTHPTHKNVMNTTEWQRARDRYGIAVTVGNILGNVQAEAIYWQTFMDYVVRLRLMRLE